MEIKNCPFCGAAAKIETWMTDRSDVEFFRAKCDGSDGHALGYWSDTSHDAVTEWNCRDLKIKFGEIELSKLGNGCWFISHENGEGMEISERPIEKMLQRYMQEYS